MKIVWALLAASLVHEPPSAVPDFSQLWVFATLERDPAWENLTRIRIGTFEGTEADPGVTYWFLREVQDEDERVSDSAWASSATCPAALPVLKRLEALEMPKPDVPGYRRNGGVIVMDGVSHRLSGVSRHRDGQPGDYSIESNNGTPLARWSDALFRALERCWRPREAAN